MTEPVSCPAPTAADIGRLAGLRWLSLAAMLLALALLAALPGVPVPHAALLAVMLGLAAINLFTLGWLARGMAMPGRHAQLLQLLVDLLAWTTFVYFTGGATNPLISMLLPLVAIGAAILPAGQAWALAAAAVGAYSLLWRYYLPLRLDDDALATRWHLAGMWLTFALSAAVIVGFLVRMNAALRARDAALAAANAALARDEKIVALGNLAAGTAHNLGTPLGTMRIVVDELLRAPPTPEQLREDLETLDAQVEQCRRMLGLLTAEAGNVRAEGGSPVRVDGWLADTIAQWQAQRPGPAVALRCDDQAAALQIVADATLAQAVHTLANNAADAQGNHAPAPVEVTAGVSGALLEIAVLDRGPGMDAHQRATAGLEPRPGTRGMGIGLFLARRAVERCGGALDFAERAGGGTIARLRIPLATLQIQAP
jgi:two-component system sensor histidine kinase RegB